MLLIDDALMFIFRKVHEAAQQEREDEADAVRAELSNLYLMLEGQQISESEFDVRERELLDRLEQVEARTTPGRGEAETAD